MGLAFKEQGEREKSIKIFERAIKIDPSNRSAEHILNSLRGDKPKTAPREYVERLFDGYADRFEKTLVGDLEYKIPKLITNVLLKMHCNNSLGSVLDLGCGTGLMGSEINGYCKELVGIDLSSKMLKHAKKKNHYTKLNQSDIITFLTNTQLDFDCFVAADVFIYVGELSEVFSLIKSRNTRSGKLAFSTENSVQDGYHLHQTGRYSHSKSYIASLCKKYEYEMSYFALTDLRKENKTFLKGGIYVLDF